MTGFRTSKTRSRWAFRKRVMRPLVERAIGEVIFVSSDTSAVTLSVSIGWGREYVNLDADEVDALLKFCREVRR